jgi:hypothetical protein
MPELLTKKLQLKLAGFVAAVALAWGVLFSGGHDHSAYANQPSDAPVMIVADGNGGGPPGNGGG